MKKVLLLLSLIFIVIISDAANRTGAIRPGDTMLSQPMTFDASDTIVTSGTYTITISNPQKYIQNQTFTSTVATVSGSPSVTITAYGKTTSGGSWVQIGSPVTWTSSSNNPIEISSATQVNYNYLKLAYVCSGATQKVKVTAFDVRTANLTYTIPGMSSVIWAKGGTVVSATTGTDAACTSGGRFWSELGVGNTVTLTGVAFLVGSVGGTDSVVVQLCNSSGVQVATSKLTGAHHGALIGTAAQFQSVPFSSTYTAAPGKYYVVLQFSGTTAKFRTYPIPGSKFIANTATGTWDTKSDITPGTTFVADKGPILMTY